MVNDKKEHFNCIDGLKGISACIIAFFWHYQQLDIDKVSPFKSIFSLSYYWGYSMVDVFFIISGFGMMLGYGKRIFDKEISFKDYFLRRIKKLYPIFIISTIIVLILEMLYLYKEGTTFVYGNFDVYHFILNLFFVQYGVLGTEYSFNGPSWTISMCVICYCLLYLVAYHSKKYRYIMYVFAVTAIVGASFIAAELRYPIFNDAMGRGIAGFSIGVLLEYVFENRDKFNSKRLGYVCFAFLILSYILFRFASTDYSGNFTISTLLGFGPMILFSVVFIPWLKVFMGNPVFKYLGRISLEIYLFHFPVQCLIKDVEIYMGLEPDYGKEIIWIGYIIIVLGVATLYHFLLSKRVDAFVVNLFRKTKEK